MDQIDTQSAIKSRTMQWLLAALIAYLVKNFGLPMLPGEVSAEMVGFIQDILLLFIPFAIAAAMYFRKQATKIIDRWF